MASYSLRPENAEERIVYYAILATWVLWLAGATFVVYPLLGWALAGLAVARRMGWIVAPDGFRHRPPPVIVTAWIAGMFMMLVALVVGHIDFGLPLGQTIKSTLGWVKGWALLAVFPFAAAMLRIRPMLLYRACNMLGLQTLVITPLLVTGALAGLPDTLYTSPLFWIVGGAPQIFFDVGTHIPDTGMLGFRLRFFAPWAPAAAFYGVVAVVFAVYDKSPLWRAIGLAAAIVMCFFSLSRLALITLPVMLLVVAGAANMLRPAVLMVLAPLVVGVLLFADPLLNLWQDAQESFTSARADSSRVRATLQSIAIHRWISDAFWFGHAVVERGPHLVEFMPIGSHHTWFGLLFVKGFIGFLACLLPMLWTFVELGVRALRDRVARAALGVLVAIGMFSFGENIEALVYIYWPALVLIGVAARRRLSAGRLDARNGAARLYRAALRPAPPPAATMAAESS